MSTRLPQSDLAIVSGSGLAVVPTGAEVVDEIGYRDLGWPASGAAGHLNRVLTARWAPPEGGPSRRGRHAATGAAEVRLLLACGRAHLYEGWSAAELARPVDDLAEAGVRWLLLTNAVGALDPGLAPGAAVVVTEVVDLQGEPRVRPPVAEVAGAAVAERLVRALAPALPTSRGRYVAVPGPHYETPAEAAWLHGFGEVVGMSAAAEVRAAKRHDLSVTVLSLVANTAGAPLDHGDVLAATGRLEVRLARGLARLVTAVVARTAQSVARDEHEGSPA